MITHLPQRSLIALALTLPVTVLAMGSHLPGMPADWVHALHQPWSIFTQGLITTLVVFGCGWPLLVKGVQSWRKRLNMFTLISLGVLITWAYSMLAALAPSVFPSSFHQHGGVPVYFEAAAMITALVLLGQWLEQRAQGKTGEAMHALLSLTPPVAYRVRADGTTEEVSPASVVPGDLLRIRPGGSVPADGHVVEGETYIDESMLTGEPLPQARRVGDPLTAGTLNTNQVIVMRAERVGADTLLARIIRRVDQAQQSRAPIQRIADRVVGWVVPSVLALSAVTFLLWYAVGPEPRLLYALINAVTVLMVTCPCALGLATPMSMMVGMGRAARHGILIRNAAILESLKSIDTVVFDKTGTLTEGQPKLVSAIPAHSGKENELVHLAASVEQHSEHPLGQAIVDGAKAWGLTLISTENVRAHPGLGVSATLGDQVLRIGRADWLADQGVTGLAPLADLAQTAETEGKTTAWVARDNACLGFLIIADPIRDTSPPALDRLRAAGRTCIMLTGDAKTTARHVANQLGIDQVHAAVLPDQKQDVIRALQAEGRIVAMIGDGINDAPALAAADIGFAVGSATSVALETADIALIDGDLSRADAAFRLGEATLRNIRQNLVFAFLYNALAIPIAAGALYPFTGILLTPALASLAMTLSSLSVVANALRLRKIGLTDTDYSLSARPPSDTVSIHP